MRKEKDQYGQKRTSMEKKRTSEDGKGLLRTKKDQ